jgi:hypothetical protein
MAEKFSQCKKGHPRNRRALHPKIIPDGFYSVGFAMDANRYIDGSDTNNWKLAISVRTG